jgi:Fur family iron response transcriptional regulator
MNTKKACLTHQEIEQQLLAKGVQPTIQRIAICQHVLCNTDHPTSEDIHAWAEKNMAKISLATVYNTLNTLTEAGMIKALRFPHTDKVVYDDNLDDHVHFYDVKSKKLYDIPRDEVEVVWKKRGFQIKSMDLVFNGEIAPTIKKD